MKRILLIGAGKSSGVLIDYLLKEADSEDWQVTVADISKEVAEEKINGHPRGKAMPFDINDEALRKSSIEHHDLVISMLPARFHPIVAGDCLAYRKHLITPSYVSEEMQELHAEAKHHGLVFMNEMGLDPGIDHMSAKKLIDEIQSEHKIIEGFESFTGGLVAPESDDNPWHYKFTWNPRNVVLAGQGDGGIKFLHNGRFKYIPYHQLFARTEFIEIDGHGLFEGYANRDSLKYREIYGLQHVKTMYRGTFRRPGFCKAWNILVQLGATDDTYIMEDCENLTHRDFINSFLKYRIHDTVELKVAYYTHVNVDSEEMALLKWLGLFENTKIGLENASPARILQHILEKKWSMKPEDKDMIVMWHKFNYVENGKEHEINSSLVVIGDDPHATAMAKTVGLPIGIATKLVLTDQIKARGIVMPTSPEVYHPVLNELEAHGIAFKEQVIY